MQIALQHAVHRHSSPVLTRGAKRSSERHTVRDLIAVMLWLVRTMYVPKLVFMDLTFIGSTCFS